MNILYIEHYAGSPDMGMEFRPYYLSREWVKMGHKVFIIAGDYSHLRRKNPAVTIDFQIEDIDGIEYVWLRTGEYEGNGAVRALTMERFVRKLYTHAKMIANRWKPDVVIASSTYPLDTWPAQRIAKIAKAKYVHEVHDMWPATLYEVGGMPKKHPFVVLMQLAENSTYKHADAVVSLPKYAKSYMMEHGLKDDHFFYIPNGIVKEEWDNPILLPNGHKEVLEKLRNDNKFIVGYFGGHALSNCLMTLIQSAEQMQGENSTVHFVLVGDGVEKRGLVQYVKDKKLKNVTFLPPINKKAIPTLTEYFDCTYIGAKDSPLYRFGVCMNKMFDGMMAEKPIIFAINAPPTPVEECGCGLIVKPENEEVVIHAIQQLIMMSPEKLREMGKSGRKKIIKEFSYGRLAEEFINVMKNV